MTTMTQENTLTPFQPRVPYCPVCGYSQEGLQQPVRCPECGRDYTDGEFVLYGWRHKSSRNRYGVIVGLCVAGLVAAFYMGLGALTGEVLMMAPGGAILAVVAWRGHVAFSLLKSPRPIQLTVSREGIAVREGFGTLKFHPWSPSCRIRIAPAGLEYRIRAEIDRPNRVSLLLTDMLTPATAQQSEQLVAELVALSGQQVKLEVGLFKER